MTCAECKPGDKCPTCLLKDRGFITKDYLEEHLKAMQDDQSRGINTANKHFNGNVDDLFSHILSCTDPSCKMANFRRQNIEDAVNNAYYAGFHSGQI